MNPIVKLIAEAILSRRGLNEDEARESHEGECLMKVYPHYNGNIPTSFDVTRFREAVEYFDADSFQVTNQDWECQDFMNTTFNHLMILVQAGEERVHQSCKNNWKEVKGSKPTNHYQNSTQLERTTLSLQYAKTDIKGNQCQCLVDKSKNVVLNEAGESIYVVCRWDAYITLQIALQSLRHNLDCLRDTANEEFTITGFSKGGKTAGALSSRMKDKSTYPPTCKALLRPVYETKGFAALPVLSVDDTVTALCEWCAAYPSQAKGNDANQKKESSTSSLSEMASVDKAYKFYLSRTNAMSRKDFYLSYRISSFYHSQRSDYLIRTAIDQVAENHRDDNTYLTQKINELNVDVLEIIQSISSVRSEQPLLEVLCPSGVPSVASEIVALAVVIARKKDIGNFLDSKHRNILAERKRRSRRPQRTTTPSASSSQSISSTDSTPSASFTSGASSSSSIRRGSHTYSG